VVNECEDIPGPKQLDKPTHIVLEYPRSMNKDQTLDQLQPISVLMFLEEDLEGLIRHPLRDHFIQQILVFEYSQQL
jgi:hypothetical protein